MYIVRIMKQKRSIRYFKYNEHPTPKEERALLEGHPGCWIDISRVDVDPLEHLTTYIEDYYEYEV